MRRRAYLELTERAGAMRRAVRCIRKNKWVIIASLLVLTGVAIFLMIADNSARAAIAPPSVRHATSAMHRFDVTDKSIAAPTMVEGDLLVAIYLADWGLAENMGFPAGFVEQGRYDVGLDDLHMIVATKVATASEPASYAFTAPVNADVRIDMLSIKDSDTSIPLTVSGQATPSSTNTHPAPSVTPLGKNDLLLSTVALDTYPTVPGAEPFSWTQPSGMTKITDLQYNNWMTMATAAQELTSNAATGTKTWTRPPQNDILGVTISLTIKGFADDLAHAMPDATVSSTWATTNHASIDEGETLASDYIATGTSGSGGEEARFSVQNIPNMSGSQRIRLNFCAYSATNANGGNLDTISGNVIVNNSVQTAVTVTPIYSASSACLWYRLVFSTSSTWTQADIDNLDISFTRNVVGGGRAASQDDDVRIVSAYATVVFPLPASITQSAYRWMRREGEDGPTGSFAWRADYTMSPGDINPISSADLNGDGAADVVTIASYTSATLQVMINDGTGAFGTAKAYTLIGDPKGGVQADFDGDLDIDIAVVSSGSVTIFPNNGDGTFATSVDYTVSTGARSVVAADFNGDSAIDIATVNEGSDSMSVLLNGGSGTFAVAVDYVTGDSPRDITVGDFDGDLDRDVAIVNSGISDSVSLLLNNGNGTFATKVDYVTNDGPREIVAADFNGDQNADVAVINDASPYNLSVFIGSGSGVLGTPSNYPLVDASNSHLTAVDLNGDQIIDIAYAAVGSKAIHARLNSGDGVFSMVRDHATVGADSNGVLVNDFNKDQVMDIAQTTTSNFGKLRLYDGAAGYRFAPIANTNASATATVRNDQLHLRMNLGVSSSAVSGSNYFKLRYNQKSTSACSSNPADYADVTASSHIRFFDDPTATDGIYKSFSSSLYDPTNANVPAITHSYEESNPFSPGDAIPAERDNLWDFSLAVDGSAPLGTYCFMVTKDDNTAIDTYAAMPELVVAEPTVEQSSYRLYKDADSTTPGSPLAAQDTPASLPAASSFRLRQLLGQTLGTTLTTDGFKLQAAEKVTTCTAATYADNIAGLTFSDNASVVDEAVIATLAADPAPTSGTVHPQTYSENAAITTRIAMQNGEYGLWDYAIKADATTEGTTYCFRIVKADGSTLNTYGYYPEITFTKIQPSLPQQLRGGQAVINGRKVPFSW